MTTSGKRDDFRYDNVMVILLAQGGPLVAQVVNTDEASGPMVEVYKPVAFSYENDGRLVLDYLFPGIFDEEHGYMAVEPIAMFRPPQRILDYYASFLYHARERVEEEEEDGK